MYGLSMEYLRRKREKEWGFRTSNVKKISSIILVIRFLLLPLHSQNQRPCEPKFAQKQNSRYLHPTGIAYEDNKIVFIHDNDLHDIIFMRITLSLFG